MPDTEDGFDEAFKGFGEDTSSTPVKTPPDPATPPDPSTDEPPKTDDKTPPEEPKKEDKPATPPVEPPKPEDPAKPPEDPEVSETQQPLTKEDVTAIISNLRDEERSSGRAVETTTQEVLDAYYPEGLSSVLTDATGRELKTPADVVAASGDSMSTEEAAQWLLNEQYKLDAQVAKIKDDARKIAETTVSFRRDSVTAVQKYAPLFKAYPHLQQKVFDKLMKQVKVDKDKNVILTAPDVLEHYDDYLEPYQQAFEFSTNQPATNPTPPTTPDPPKPSAEDRMDESGDGGTTPVDDPNDFAQQVSKELAKGM